MWPELTRDHYRLVDDVLRVGRLTDGPMVERFEEAFAEKVGARHAVMCSSGTAAIHAALIASGAHMSPMVHVPSFTFSGTTLGAAHLGMQFDWMDADLETGNVTNFSSIAQDTAPVIIVHLHGNPAPVPATQRVIIEDCAQSFGSLASIADNEWTGRQGTAACWSLNATKIMWAGEGGVVTCDHDGIAAEVRNLVRFGGSADRTDNALGYNWKPAEVMAALGIASLLHVDRWVDAAVRNAAALSEHLKPMLGVIRPLLPTAGTAGNGHKYRVMVPEKVNIDELIRLLNIADVPACRWQTRPLPAHPGYEALGYRKRSENNSRDARFILDHSVILGTETAPLQMFDESAMPRWATVLTDLIK
jgi:perosamine synthetase